MSTSINNAVRVSFVGDINLCGGVLNNYLMKSRIAHMSVYDYLRNSDCVIGNIECTLSEKGEIKKDKHVCLRAPSVIGKAIRELGINVAMVANNHINDYGEEAFFDTLHNITQQGINTVGGGVNISEARKPVVIKVKGCTLGFLNYSDAEDNYATMKKYGIAPGKDEYIISDIRSLENHADIIIVGLHAGIEFSRMPSQTLISKCDKYIKAGASIIVGHHPHVFQPVKMAGNKLTAYSLGNFIFDPNYLLDNTHSAKTGILTIEIRDKNTLDYSIEPCFIDEKGLPSVVTDLHKRQVFYEELNDMNNIMKKTKYLKRIQRRDWLNNKIRQIKIVATSGKSKGLPYLVNYMKNKLKLYANRLISRVQGIARTGE